MNNLKDLPIIGKRYNCFDDGKISYSRMYQVLITDILKFEDADSNLKHIVESIQQNYDWLYPNTTDYIICAVSYERENYPQMSYFIRTKDGGWFSIGEILSNGEIDSLFCSGRLDIEGTLTNHLKEMFKNE